METKTLTGARNYFEDFEVGAVIRHSRGKTVTPLENVLITNLVMNTSHGHFNDHAMIEAGLQGSLVYGGVNFSLVLGLAAQDCCENALEELGLDSVKLLKHVYHGDTLYAFSRVSAKEDGPREDAGIVTFEHYGYNQRDERIAEVVRRVLVKRRGADQKISSREPAVAP